MYATPSNVNQTLTHHYNNTLTYHRSRLITELDALNTHPYTYLINTLIYHPSKNKIITTSYALSLILIHHDSHLLNNIILAHHHTPLLTSYDASAHKTYANSQINLSTTFYAANSHHPGIYLCPPLRY